MKIKVTGLNTWFCSLGERDRVGNLDDKNFFCLNRTGGPSNLRVLEEVHPNCRVVSSRILGMKHYEVIYEVPENFLEGLLCSHNGGIYNRRNGQNGTFFPLTKRGEKYTPSYTATAAYLEIEVLK